jgi:hypothetical protein
VALPDNVKSIAGRGPGTRRPLRTPSPASKPTPFDSLLGLAIEFENREATAPPRHLSAVPPPAPPVSPPHDVDTAPVPLVAPPIEPTLPTAPRPTPAPPSAQTTPAVPTSARAASGARPSRSTEYFLIVVALALAAMIAALLVWGDHLERLVRPDVERDPPALDASAGSTPDVTPAVPPASSPVSAAPAPVACDTASVAVSATQVNSPTPLSVAWVRCQDRYATAGLVPAGSAPETPAAFVATLRADGASWTLLWSGDPATCASSAPATDPAFPPALCG